MSTEHSQWSLLSQRRFAPFFLTQFCGAANDNIFKFAFTLLVTYHAAEINAANPALVVNLIAALFVLPFVLFSATSGQLSDRYGVTQVMRLVKVLEVAFMLIGAVGFITKNLPLLLVTTFLMGLHSTLFGPAKFAYLPQHLRPDEIVGGNGLVEMGTFVAILLGTMGAGFLMKSEPGAAATGVTLAAATTLVVAFVGLAASLMIPKTAAVDAALKINWNPFSETWRNLKLAHKDIVVFRSLLGISWLWFFGATFLTQFSVFSKDVLGGNEGVVTLLLAVFSIGIGMGSVLCERLSGRMVEIGLVPFGSIGMSVFAIDLYFASRGLAPVGQVGVGAFLANSAHWRVIIDLFLLSMFAGFYSVPLYALIQTRGEATHRSRIIAANNILNALFMVVSAGMGAVLLGKMGFTIPQLFLVTGLLNALVAAYIFLLVPEFLLRFIAWILVHTIYRVKKEDTDRIPATGAALLTANHVSFVDAVVLMAISPRPIRFVMDRNIFRIPFLSWFFRTAKAIPICSAKEDPAVYQRAFDEVSRELRDGELVLIFPEGAITHDGEMGPFKGGVMKILERDPVPVVPIALRGFWGSFFSRKDGPAMSAPLRRGFNTKVGIAVGLPVQPAAATPEGLRESTLALRGDWK
ncbi:glycerol acyltransferase [beta proteobacterium AAP99]|nr:glycerol acyltransferase [beta proteobacterium AAP99]